MKSPGTNSPASSTKKQRSASPSNATPKSARSSRFLRDDELAVLRQERVRLVVRERPVRLEVTADDVEHRQPVEHRRQHRPGHPVRRVDHDPERPERRRRRRTTARDRRNRARCPRSRISPRAASRHSPRHRAVAHVEQAGLAADRQRAAAHDLHPRVLLRVVRRGDRDAAVEPELADREIDHLRADEPEVEHVRAAVGGALAHGRRHRRRREPHVAPDGDPRRRELLDVRAADRDRRRPRRARPDRGRGRRTP